MPKRKQTNPNRETAPDQASSEVDPAIDPTTLLNTLLATGLDVVAACDQIAATNSDLAQEAFLAWGSVIPGMPERECVWSHGRITTGSLDLSNRDWLTELPQFSVQGDLNLRGCVNLSGFPEVIEVCGTLDIRGCKHLDRVIHDNILFEIIKTDKNQ